MIRPQDSSMAIVWRFITGILLSTALLLAGIIGNDQNNRIKTLEERDRSIAEKLSRIETKVDLIISQHDVKFVPKNR